MTIKEFRGYIAQSISVAGVANKHDIDVADRIFDLIRDNLKDIVKIDREILKKWVIDIDKQGRIIEVNPVRLKEE